MTDTAPAVEETADASSPEPERPAVEVVETPAAETLPATQAPPSALERAAEAALAMPGLPGRDEFLMLAVQARILSMSRGAPKEIRNDPHLAFHVAMIGRDLGISPSAAIAQIDVIGTGEDATPSLSPELLNGQIRRLGLGSIVKAASSDAACTAVALLPGGRVDARCARVWPGHVTDDTPGGPCTCTLDKVLGDVEFTWADAQQGNLAHRDCTGPTAHTDACIKGGSGSQGKRCHQGYRTYPKRMMWWRAAGWCAADYFPDASIGLYSPEELGAVVDPETGRPIDPASVSLPDGYEPEAKPPDPADDRVYEATVDGDADLHAVGREIQARVDAVKMAGPDALAALKALWEETGDDGYRRTPALGYLQRRHVLRVRAMLTSVEQRIRKGEWGDVPKAAWQEATDGAAQAPQDAATLPVDETAPDAENAQETEPQAATDAASETDEDAAARRKARAEQVAAEAGIDPADRERMTADVRLADAVAAEVKALGMTDVIAGLTERSLDVPSNPQAQRRALAEAIYAERKADRAAGLGGEA